MKYYFFILLFLLLAPSLYAQSEEEQKIKPEPAPQNQNEQILDGSDAGDNESPQKENRKGFVDEDGDGLDDRLSQTPPTKNDRNKSIKEERKERKRRMDTFIDNNGDGINDSRSTGIGMGKRAKMRRGGKK